MTLYSQFNNLKNGSSNNCVKDKRFNPLSELRKLRFEVFLTFLIHLMVKKNYELASAAIKFNAEPATNQPI